MSWLENSEKFALAGACIGTIIAGFSQQAIYAVAPLTLTLLFNKINQHKFKQDVQKDLQVLLSDSNPHQPPELPEIIEGNEIDNYQGIESFLNSKSITIKSLPKPDEADDIINTLALFLGDRYDSLGNLLKQIKRCLNKGSSFTEYIGDYSQVDISNICQFCSRLYENAFLEEYRYFKSPKYIIKAKPSRLPKAINFFSGQWLERYIYQIIIKNINVISNNCQQKIAFNYILNPQVTLPNGDDFELDIIFEIANKLYWIETKTGDYQQYIHKYSKVASQLDLDKSHAMMVLTDINDSTAKSLSKIFSMSVCSVSDFSAVFQEMLLTDLK